ncbi:MAG: glycosyltransferase family 39 protein [Planctomycetes bacterium]|nr:glycosyltransferase family 39 protein [Planctomycetota bacterium]
MNRIFSNNKDCLVWLLLAGGILFTAATRIHLLNVPLERDEGAYAYIGQLLLEGHPPYVESYDFKMPGLYGAYAIILMIFGQTAKGIHLGLLLINSTTIVLLFMLGRKLFGNLCGISSAAAFAILSLITPVQGFIANAEHFVLLPAVAGILVLLRWKESDRLPTIFLGGVLLGLSVIMKQQGAFFILFGGLYVLFSQLQRRSLKWPRRLVQWSLFAAGALMPFVVICLLYWVGGHFDKFWFWVFVYPMEYAASRPSVGSLPVFVSRLSRIIEVSALLWVLAGFGLISILWDRKIRPNALFVGIFLLLSLVSVCLGGSFFPHYFILMLPAVALLVGTGACSISHLLGRISPAFFATLVPFFLVIIGVSHCLYIQGEVLYKTSMEKVSRKVYRMNPFPESLAVSEYIKAHTSENDRIFIFGSEPQMFFYSHRKSATKYINIGLIEFSSKHSVQMQEEIIRDIDSANPALLVFVDTPRTILFKSAPYKIFYDWLKDYTQHYRLVGIVDIFRNSPTVYRWDDAATGQHPESEISITVFSKD